MKLTATQTSELSKIFTTKTFNKDKDNERTIHVFNDDIMNSSDTKITDKFFELKMEVDDYHYKWLHGCLSEYSEKFNEYIDTELSEIPFDEIEDSIIDDLEPDVYNWDRLQWISSNLTRASYVDDALEQLEWKSFYDLIGFAQLDEMNEVYQIGFEFVRWYLNEYSVE